MPRPQTFQPMRWACQPSQSSTPASSPCGISVSPLRGSFSTKTLRGGVRSQGCCRRASHLEPSRLLPARPHCRTAQHQGIKGPGASAVARQACTHCRKTAKHQQHHKGPGAARRSARRAMGICTRTQFLQHPSKTGSSSWPQCPGPRRSSQCAGPASRARAARRQAPGHGDQRIAAAQLVFQAPTFQTLRRAAMRCGISVSPLRGSFSQKLCAAACVIPQAAAIGSALAGASGAG